MFPKHLIALVALFALFALLWVVQSEFMTEVIHVMPTMGGVIWVQRVEPSPKLWYQPSL